MLRRTRDAPSGKKNAGIPVGLAGRSQAEPPVERSEPLLQEPSVARVDLADSATRHRESRIRRERGDQRLEGVVDRVRVIVEHEQQIGRRLAGSEVSPGDPRVPARLEQAHVPSALADELCGAVGRSVVDDEDLGERQRREAVEHDGHRITPVVRQDHCGDGGLRGRRAACGHLRSLAAYDSPSMRGHPPPLALAYHGVEDVPLRHDVHRLFVRPRDLRRQIELLRGWGYTLTTFGDLADRALRPRSRRLRSAHVRRRLRGQPTTLLPLLAESGVPATVFVVSGWFGQLHPYAPHARILREDELRSLRDGGVEIGAHSVTHPDLSKLGYEAALSELAESKAVLEAILEASVEVAAYPFGRATDETIRACRDAGFRAACRISGEGSWDEPHNLPRQDMDNRCTVVGLRLKREDRYEPLMRYAPFRVARSVRRRLLALR